MSDERLTDEEVQFWASRKERDVKLSSAQRAAVLACAELLTRRAADLSPEEVEALRWAKRDLVSMHTPYHTSDHEQYLAAIAALSRLLGER